MAKKEIKKKDDFITRWLENSGLSKKYPWVFTAKDWLITIFFAFLFATFFRTFFYENFKIPSGSMNPVLLNGDRVLVNKFHYGYSKFSFPFDFPPINGRILSNRTPKRGDIVVFKTKESEKTGIYYIKRIVGLPNDRIQLKDNQIYINGEKLGYNEVGVLEKKTERNHNSFPSLEVIENNGDKKYSVLISDINSIAGNTREYIVPEGHYFCMGDNRDNSKDSRFSDFGFIPFENIVGRAERIFFSTANGSFNFNKIFKSIQAEQTEN